MKKTKTTNYNKIKIDDAALKLAHKVLEDSYQGGSNIFQSPDGGFWSYKNTHWVPTSATVICLTILETVSASPSLKPEGKALAPFVKQAFQIIEFLLATDTDLLGFNGDVPSVINVENGELWIGDDGKPILKTHNPKSGLTHCAPFSFNATATCEKIDTALNTIFSLAQEKEEMVNFFWELFGYAIQPRRKRPYFVVFIGTGANGKTQLLKTIQKLVGEDAVLNDSIDYFFRDNFALSALIGKLLLIDDDLKKGTVLDDGLLKKMSEDKSISARRAYGRTKLKFRSRILPLMAGNSYPLTTDASLGMRRRAIVVPFDYNIPEAEQNPNLFPEIWKTELPGILNKAIEGYRRFVERGEKFDYPIDVQESINEFFLHADPFNWILSEICAEDPGGKLRLVDLRFEIRAKGQELGFKTIPSADNTLKRSLEELGYVVKKTNGFNTVYGLRLVE